MLWCWRTARHGSACPPDALAATADCAATRNRFRYAPTATGLRPWPQPTRARASQVSRSVCSVRRARGGVRPPIRRLGSAADRTPFREPQCNARSRSHEVPAGPVGTARRCRPTDRRPSLGACEGPSWREQLWRRRRVRLAQVWRDEPSRRHRDAVQREACFVDLREAAQDIAPKRHRKAAEWTL